VNRLVHRRERLEAKTGRRKQFVHGRDLDTLGGKVERGAAVDDEPRHVAAFCASEVDPLCRRTALIGGLGL
jgi:hypothetical protein